MEFDEAYLCSIIAPSTSNTELSFICGEITVISDQDSGSKVVLFVQRRLMDRLKCAVLLIQTVCTQNLLTRVRVKESALKHGRIEISKIVDAYLK